MSTSHTVPSPAIHSDDESTSSEEDSPSSDEDDVPKTVDYSGGDNVVWEEDSSSEEIGVPRIVDYSRGDNVTWEEDPSSEESVVRDIPEPTFLTTAQKRTKTNMFGVTNTEYTQMTITDPVLYIALYSTGDAPLEVDDYHWAFIVGPSHEEPNSKGTLYNMEPRQAPGYKRPYGGEWCWMYNQPTVPLRGQSALLARLMIAEVADMDMLQAVILRWGSKISMREHVEWMSVRWVKTILKSLDEDGGCLGRRMESFDSVEAEGRWLAETEEEKRKGFCLLDTRINTRILFERERAAALLSTATVDIAIKHPVLYVAIYKTDRPSCNDQHWTFLIGPSIETAESEGVRCGVELHLDSNGWPTWDYTQTIVPLWGEDDLLTRIMVAEIADLAPLGAIMRDQEVTPMTERAGTMVGDLELSSFTWVWGKMEMLERKPECFAGECTALRMFEQAGYRLVVDWCQSAVDELVERVRMRGCRKRKRRLSAIGMKTLNFVYGWKQPVDDGADPLVNPNVERGDSSTISRSDQIVTGVLGAAALEMRQRVAERKRREMTGEQERGASVKPKGSENALSSAQRTKSEHVNEVEGVAENRSEKEATASLESPRVPTTNLVVPRKPEEATGEKKIAKDEEEDENTDQDKEARVTNTAAVKIIEPNKPGDATEGKKVVTQDEEDEDETESEDEDEEDEDEDEDEEEDEEESDATDDNDEDDDNGKDEPKGMAGGSTKEKKANARPDGVRGTSVHFAELYKPEMAIEGEKNIAKEDGDEPESEEDESADEDEDEEEEDDEEESEDSDSDNEEDEEDDYSDNDSDDDEEGEEEHAAAHTTLKKIPAITLSA